MDSFATLLPYCYYQSWILFIFTFVNKFYHTEIIRIVNSIHTFKVEGIDGGLIDFADYTGKKILIVNVASKCGFTPQYRQLQELYNEFQDKLVIIGFPCNDFGAQEPGSNEDISAFCKEEYGIRFPLTAKISIKGSDSHPIYEWLTDKNKNGVMDSTVAWNFQKYLLDEKGRLVHVFPSSASPFDDQVLNWLA
jgi:glutathione peroxidase